MAGWRVWVAVAALTLAAAAGCRSDERPHLGAPAHDGAVTPKPPAPPRTVGEPSALTGEEAAPPAADVAPAAE